MSYQVNLKNLSPLAKEWLLYGIAGIVIADGIVMKDEMEFLGRLWKGSLKSDSDLMEKLADCIIHKKLPGEMPKKEGLEVDETLFILDKFIETIYADQVYDQQEKEFFKDMCVQLGLGKELVCERMDIEYVRIAMDPERGEKELEHWHQKAREEIRR